MCLKAFFLNKKPAHSKLSDTVSFPSGNRGSVRRYFFCPKCPVFVCVCLCLCAERSLV